MISDSTEHDTQANPCQDWLFYFHEIISLLLFFTNDVMQDSINLTLNLALTLNLTLNLALALNPARVHPIRSKSKSKNFQGDEQ